MVTNLWSEWIRGSKHTNTYVHRERDGRTRPNWFLWVARIGWHIYMVQFSIFPNVLSFIISKNKTKQLYEPLNLKWFSLVKVLFSCSSSFIRTTGWADRVGCCVPCQSARIRWPSPAPHSSFLPVHTRKPLLQTNMAPLAGFLHSGKDPDQSPGTPGFSPASCCGFLRI